MNINLISQSTYVSTPFISVTIGNYKFGIIEKSTGITIEGNNVYKDTRVTYPNYLKSLEITKINGQVNKYTLKLEYTVTDRSDPNFFEKVFSSVSDSRKIVFSYGDYSAPTYTSVAVKLTSPAPVEVYPSVSVALPVESVVAVPKTVVPCLKVIVIPLMLAGQVPFIN